MHFQPRETWSLLLVSLISLGTVANAANSGIIEIDLLFPRNETYAPTEWMPIVFSIRNGELTKHLGSLLEYRGWNKSDFGAAGFSATFDNLKWANWSSQEKSSTSPSSTPYFVYDFRDDLQKEGSWRLSWDFLYVSCNEGWDPNRPNTGRSAFLNTTSRSVEFTIKKDGGQPVDLVAATANDKTCFDESVAAINVTGKTQPVRSADFDMDDRICAVVGSPEPTTTPCQVKVDSAVAASMTASLRARLCNPLITLDPPADCEDSAAQRLAVAGLASLAAAAGIIGFLA